VKNIETNNMDKNFELKGYWWLPETPEYQIPGTLSFSPSELNETKKIMHF